MIHLFYTYLNESQHQVLLEKYTSSFPREFQERLLKFRRWQDQQASLLGRVLLENGMRQLYQYQLPEISFGKYGKPFFKQSDIQFNISHSHHLVVCGITKNSRIGIDVEYQKPINIQDFKFQMTEKEWKWISTAEDAEAAFYEYWTKKEAIIKAVGKGFSADLKAFEVLAGIEAVFFEAINWKLEMLPINKDYVCSLASDKAGKVEYQQFQEMVNNK